MIYIDLSSFVPNDEWLQQANQLTQDLINATDKKDFIETHKSFWSEIKDDLKKLSHNKCWYSEQSVLKVQLEHFRPKNAVSRIGKTKLKKINNVLKNFSETQRSGWTTSKHLAEGYWWLAFDFTNFRIIETTLNEIKGTFFPLNGNYVAYNPTDIIANEDNILLDPSKKGDTELLTFNSDGLAFPINTDKNAYAYVRAFISIQIYGLNHPHLKNFRENRWKDCNDLINEINEIYYPRLEEIITSNRQMQEEDVRYLDFFGNKSERLKKYLSSESDFSAVAMACVKSYSYEWIKEYILK